MKFISEICWVGFKSEGLNYLSVILNNLVILPLFFARSNLVIPAVMDFLRAHPRPDRLIIVDDKLMKAIYKSGKCSWISELE